MTENAVHTISLDSIHDSKITNINLYTSRAQVTRSYKVNVAAGQTKLTLSCLPNVVDHESIRVEGRGPAIIQGVSAFKTQMEEPMSTSPLLQQLNHKLEKATTALQRSRKTIQAIDKYMGSIVVEHLDISKLGETMDICDTTGEKWDDKIAEIEKEIESLEDQISRETERLEKQGENRKLRTKVVVGLVAESPAELEIILIYAVSHASWEAGYDIRVDMQKPGAPVQVIYKAAINQRTGEVWENVPITLETASPTFGLDLPHLGVWNISYQTPSGSGRGPGQGVGGAKRHRKILPDEDDQSYMGTEAAAVTSKGNVNATFRVPGLTTIPSDEEEHSVTIADLQLVAKVSWVCIPKGNTKVHLEAIITNSSEYTFLRGPSNVYVDHSFISRSDIPGVSPLEVFTCPLGVDPSIRVTYLPVEKIASESGFYNKSLKYAYSQRISVHNTKSVAIDSLKIIDRIPVSQDANLVVNLINPTLTLPVSTTASISKKAPSAVVVRAGVVAQWNGTEKPGSDLSALGRDGKLNWICSVPALGRINLLLQWEVIDTQKTQVYGL